MYISPINIIKGLHGVIEANRENIDRVIRHYRSSDTLHIFDGLRKTLPMSAYPSLEFDPVSERVLPDGRPRKPPQVPDMAPVRKRVERELQEHDRRFADGGDVHVVWQGAGVLPLQGRWAAHNQLEARCPHWHGGGRDSSIAVIFISAYTWWIYRRSFSMAVKSEQIEYLKFRKSLDKALRDNELVKVDYEYDLGKKDVMDDTKSLLNHLVEIEELLVRIREMMR